jgi:hypothetical protein
VTMPIKNFVIQHRPTLALCGCSIINLCLMMGVFTLMGETSQLGRLLNGVVTYYHGVGSILLY